MAFTHRRIVTGLDNEGKSCVVSDKTLNQIPECQGVPAVIWKTDGYPVSNVGNDEAAAPFGTDTFTSSTFFLLFSPSSSDAPSAWHTTDTIDYVVVLSGKVLLELETGSVELKAGDLIVDRGVKHSWRETGGQPATLLAAVVRAEPLGEGASFGDNFDQYIKS
ncbi:cupin domain-containing protein [Burkholderia sp. Ac-20384]|uniref:cupin domain-containing protein n=1 Tax=Burkholderia sp. Ac-20384 TaxID=2703902 RepID=UPI00197DF4C6|nr:cupin domain-containing protein [Burkholderia sp. Ac-20384]MBN3822871.1 cupin domain-containing protein [Burkholderia sp. Ac-20384]